MGLYSAEANERLTLIQILLGNISGSGIYAGLLSDAILTSFPIFQEYKRGDSLLYIAFL